MEKRAGLTLVDVVTIFVIIFIVLFIGMLLLSQLSRRASRVVCGTNLKGLGTAMVVYANDYDDDYPKLGHGPWSKTLGYSYEDPGFKAPEYRGACTITSSLYLLVREADVSPKSFICPQSEQIPFEGQNTKGLDLIELWDFGADPYKHVSFVYHNPYGKYPPSGLELAAFAVAANMSPWFKNGNILSPNSDKALPPQIIKYNDASTFEKGNSLNHTEYERDVWLFRFKVHKDCGLGQNVLFGDGHTSFETQPNVGVNNDNIFTFWSSEDNPSEQDIQGGTAPTGRSPENDAKSRTDSFLAI